MIISLYDAEEIYPGITQEDLNGLEQAIRAETNNPFQNRSIRFSNLSFANDKVTALDNVQGLRRNDTVQISGSIFNDGLYTISSIDGNTLTLSDAKFFDGVHKMATVTKVEYPADIVFGVKKLLEYDAQMKGKIGLKSKTVSRMSETYFDQNSTETVAGYPVAMMSFIDKYRRMRW